MKLPSSLVSSLTMNLNAGARMIPLLPLPRPFAEPCHLVDCQLSLRHITAPHRTKDTGSRRDTRQKLQTRSTALRSGLSSFAEVSAPALAAQPARPQRREGFIGRV